MNKTRHLDRKTFKCEMLKSSYFNYSQGIVHNWIEKPLGLKIYPTLSGVQIKIQI